MTYQNILVRTEERVGIITLNRPQALNALNSKLMDELSEAIGALMAQATDDRRLLLTIYTSALWISYRIAITSGLEAT